MAHDASLKTKLAASLPRDHHFCIHHLSTPPTPCPAIYSAPPGQRPEKTYCESQFLSVSIAHSDHQIQILALEVLIYTTEHLTTIFVAKADSTGYLHLLNLPKGSPSPLKTIPSVFLSHLVTTRQRKDRQLVVSLFARAQDQYLFPGSVENPRKHVLDDRGLVKWWCRVLEPVLQAGTTWHSPKYNRKHESSAAAYLRVPGCDLHETRSFFPATVRLSSNNTTPQSPKWHASRDPLLHLGRSPAFPERCLIPRFPDDPKSRFVDELDEELTEPPPPPAEAKEKESPSKGKRPGRWRSVRSLEQFWELMAFRQECSSGRLVGFLWGVFTPQEGMMHGTGDAPGSPTRRSVVVGSAPVDHVTGSLSPGEPHTTSISSTKQDPPVKTKYSFWPPSTRGTVVLPQKHYDRVNKLLLHLDYATLDVAVASTKRWVEDVAMCAGRKEGWGVEVIGEKEVPVEDGGREVGGNEAGGVNFLGAGMVKKRKKVGEEGGKAEDGGGGGVQVLSAGLIRKKPKVK
ncbi:MAG: hypothetical protein LQ338_003918 [Usnochroma carphineum]|nr:MAG: hypothetical protein LQ338_003918 [Usnochroma carphineum]